MSKLFKYRFKTEQEFIKEYGINWKRSNPIFWNDNMDYLLGTDFNYNFNGDDRVDIPDKNCTSNCWTISISHVKKVDLKPTYKPRKFVY